MVRAAAAAAAAAAMLTGQTAIAGTAAADNTENVNKNETVYVIADAEGTPQDVIVSDWLENASGEQTLEDESDLEDIENVKGDEPFTEDGDGEITWDAGGDDIYYQGESSDQLPVTVKVTYLLDGEEVTADEIAGKSGEVTIRYDFENHEEREAEIDGEKSTLHVPFTVAAGFLLDDDAISDVSITNGRVLSDGEHTIAVGIAFPGIADDLENPAYASLTNLIDAEVPDYIEITGRTEDFSWGEGYVLVTNEIFSASEGDAGSFIDEVFGKLGSLKGGVVQIMDGVTKLNDGAGDLKSGSAELAEGLGKLTENNEALTEGAEKIFDSALEIVKEQLNAAGVAVEELTKDNYESVLGLVMTAADKESKEKVGAALEQLKSLQEYSEGIAAYTEGVAAAKEGADKVSQGSADLQAGAAGLLLGTGMLNAAIPDLSGVQEALKESISIGESYTSFSGISDGMNGKVRFIWKVEGIN